MPRGDGTGPLGKGSGIGRGMGLGRGMGRGLGRGRGMCRGQGIGRGRMFRGRPSQESNYQLRTTQHSKQSAKAVVDKEKCAGCGICVDVCPQDAIIIDTVAKIDVDRCIGCGICVKECPNEAISLKK